MLNLLLEKAPANTELEPLSMSLARIQGGFRIDGVWRRVAATGWKETSRPDSSGWKVRAKMPALGSRSRICEGQRKGA